jgi:universal stress protein E
VAAQDGAALHVLHVYRDPWHALPPPQSLTTHMPDFHERLAEAVWDHLRAFCKPFEHEAGALKAAFHAVKSERHGPSIVDFAAGNRCDLVVLGTRAKWNARDFFLGSTAERVVREAPCSVLAVKPPGFEGA